MVPVKDELQKARDGEMIRRISLVFVKMGYICEWRMGVMWEQLYQMGMANLSILEMYGWVSISRSPSSGCAMWVWGARHHGQ